MKKELLLLLVISFIFISGCVSQEEKLTKGLAEGTEKVDAPRAIPAEGLGSLCSGEEECKEFCLNNRGRCEEYCNNNPEDELCKIIFPQEEKEQPMAAPKPTITPDNRQSSQATAIWSSRDYVWYPNSIPPTCPEPFILQTPVDMSLVTGALWPGQVRGEYKAHGGFHFNNDGTNNINVRAPVGGHLIQASQYLESGEKQYLLIFSVPCGFVYRFDHPRVLSPKLAEAVKNLPPPTEGDSRTSYINPPVWVDAGEIVATSIGITKNIFVDFGLYDVRKPNNIIPNPSWAELYTADKEFGHYGVCFFDYLPGNDGATMRSIPTGKEGKASDYCK